jgi:hypothetical protein
MPQMGFESTIPVFEQAKTVHALDRAATVTGLASVTGSDVKKLTNSWYSKHQNLDNQDKIHVSYKILQHHSPYSHRFVRHNLE